MILKHAWKSILEQLKTHCQYILNCSLRCDLYRYMLILQMDIAEWNVRHFEACQRGSVLRERITRWCNGQSTLFVKLTVLSQSLKLNFQRGKDLYFPSYFVNVHNARICAGHYFYDGIYADPKSNFLYTESVWTECEVIEFESQCISIYDKYS